MLVLTTATVTTKVDRKSSVKVETLKQSKKVCTENILPTHNLLEFYSIEKAVWARYIMMLSLGFGPKHLRDKRSKWVRLKYHL